MEQSSLQAYIEHKNMIAEQSINLSSEEIDRIKAELQEFKSGDRVLFTVDDNKTAHMSITGVLEPKPDPCAIMFGFDMTTYSDIINGITEAEKTEGIENMVLYFDTPGGNVVGLFKAADVIRNSSLNITGKVVGMAASAGYALLSQCKLVECENESNEVGSIGVLTTRIDRTEQDKRDGIVRHTLVSDDTPNKAPDVSTEKGRLQITERLTKIKNVFVGYVAAGRNTTTTNVSDNFGKGAVLIARDALNAGMIDKIESELPTIQKATEPKLKKISTEELMADITLSEEKINEMVEKAALKATETTAATFEKRIATAEAETKRKAGFQALIAKYPNQISLINDEMNKPGAIATADFAIKMAETEASRIAAETEQKSNATDKVDDTKPKAEETDTSADDFVALASQGGF